MGDLSREWSDPPPVFRCSHNHNTPAPCSQSGHLVLVLPALMFFWSWQLGMFCQDQWKLGQWLKDSRIPTKKSVMKCTGLFRFIFQGENILYYFLFQHWSYRLLSNNLKKYFCREVIFFQDGAGRDSLSVLNRSEGTLMSGAAAYFQLEYLSC